MALRRTRQPVNTTEHLMAFMLKHEETIARLDKELRELTAEVVRLAAGLDTLDRTIAQVPELLDGLEARTAQAIADAFIANRTPTAKPAPASTPTAKKSKKSPKHNKVYTADEIALALMLREQGATYRQIGAALGRSAGAVERLMNTRLKNGDTAVKIRNGKRSAR